MVQTDVMEHGNLLVTCRVNVRQLEPAFDVGIERIEVL